MNISGRKSALSASCKASRQISSADLWKRRRECDAQLSIDSSRILPLHGLSRSGQAWSGRFFRRDLANFVGTGIFFTPQNACCGLNFGICILFRGGGFPSFGGANVLYEGEDLSENQCILLGADALLVAQFSLSSRADDCTPTH